MSDNNPGSQGGPPYGERDKPQYGENEPKYGENQPQYGQQDQPKYGENQPQYGQQDQPKYGESQPQYGQAPSPYGQQGSAPYGQQSPYGQGAGNYPGQQGYQVQTAENPGKTLGIVGFILAILIAPVGLVISIIAFVKSRKAKMGNGFALAGIIIGAVFTVLGAIALIGLIALIPAFTELAELCQGVPSGTQVEFQGTTTTCP
ncbi:DUF4190 domain-containing protein [Arthrobacter sp. L77]|uniref:DUF4190 domain-containing protein n=1 Tax=Arthrobacter sp. L77 TaxID=1496689 RepID=UPI0005BBC1BD|nr:DUF4190 domain-containing protein [Arthrobacter sp. L77]